MSRERNARVVILGPSIRTQCARDVYVLLLDALAVPAEERIKPPCRDGLGEPAGRRPGGQRPGQHFLHERAAAGRPAPRGTRKQEA